jgi:hypothetical protein
VSVESLKAVPFCANIEYRKLLVRIKQIGVEETYCDYSTKINYGTLALRFSCNVWKRRGQQSLPLTA